MTAGIAPGTCDTLEEDPQYELIVPGAVDAEWEGQTDTTAAMRSATAVDASLDELLAGAYAVTVEAEEDNGSQPIVCGDLGGVPGENGLAFGLAPAEGSGRVGMAWMRDNGEGGVEVQLFLAASQDLLSDVEAPEEATPRPAPAAATPEAEDDAGDTESPTAVSVEAVDIDFNPNELSIAAGTDVTVTLSNTGATVHTFTIDELGIDEELDPGETRDITINAEAGEYTFYCRIPGHAEAGQVGTLIVE